MELRVLRYFLTVVREESITKAAEVLHITQPTLSRQLAQLEEETGVQLFHRGSRKITLTNEGILLKRRAEEILELVDKTSQELAEQEEQIEGVIALGSGEFAAAQTLARLCGSFRECYPRVSFDLRTATADVVKEQIERGLIDIGLLLEPVDMEKFEFIRLETKENWVVLMRPDDPLACKEAIRAEDLKELPLILPRRLNVQSELANWFGSSYSGLKIAFTQDLVTNGAILVQNGYGYAVAIEGSCSLWSPSLITTRPLSPPLTATTVLAWRRGQPLGKATEKFISYMKMQLTGKGNHAFQA
jgi:DNA-binding transcriptional LysR family regulator